MERLSINQLFLKERDEVKIFLLGKGVECESIDTDKFKVSEQMQQSDTYFWLLLPAT